MRTTFLLAVLALALSACNGFDHAGCPNDPYTTLPNTGVKQVLHTCN